MSLEGKSFHLPENLFHVLREEDRRYNWSKGPKHDISGRPHHLPKAQWAWPDQEKFGTHRRGPTRRSR
jgi:hypothetical protein